MTEKIVILMGIVLLHFGLLEGQDVFSASVEIQNMSTINNTVVFGKVLHPEKQKILFKYYRNNISLEEETLEVPILDDSTFHFAFTLNAPIPIYLVTDDDTRVEIYIEPNDSLHITCNSKKPKHGLEFSGRGSVHNTFLFESNAKATILKELIVDKHFEAVQDDQAYFKEMSKVHTILLNQYRNDGQSNWTKSFQHYAKASIDYWWAANLLKFKKHHQKSSFRLYSEMNQFDYYDFLNKVNINNEFALNNTYYVDFLEQFIKFCNEYEGIETYLSAKNIQIPKKSKISIQRYVKVHMHGIEVLESPYKKKKVLRKLDYGTELLYLRNRTTDNIKYRKGDFIYSAPFFQVEVKAGLVGWISGAGISFLDKRIDLVELNESQYAPLTGTESVEKYLTGKVMYFSKAKALYWKTYLNDLDEAFAIELADFRNDNPFVEYTQILSKAYEVAQLRGKGDMNLVKTYAYSNLTTPIIKGVDIKLPFEESSYVQSVSSNFIKKSKEEYEDIPLYNNNHCGQETSINLDISGELLLYTNDVLFSEKRYLIHGVKEFSFRLYQPILGEVIIDKIHYPIKISPGDHLKITFDVNTSLPLYSQKGYIINKYLRDDFVKFGKNITNISAHLEKDAPSEFELYIRNIEHEKLEFISINNLLSDIEKKYWVEDTKYWSAFYLLKYASQYASINKTRLPDDYFAFLNSIDISKDWMLPNLNYSYFLESYINYFDLNADEVLVGEARSYQKVKDLAMMCLAGNSSAASKSIIDFIDDCENPVYCETITSIYNEQKGLMVGSKAMDFTLTDIQGQQVQLNDFKGKVIFVDFWASWCMPCIRSMYKSQQLIAQEKDMVFIYVSLDDDINQWRSFVQSRNFKGVHLFVDQKAFSISNIAKLYEAYQLPKYVLIDKNMNIAFPNAAKPGTILWDNQVLSLEKERVE